MIYINTVETIILYNLTLYNIIITKEKAYRVKTFVWEVGEWFIRESLITFKVFVVITHDAMWVLIICVGWIEYFFIICYIIFDFIFFVYLIYHESYLTCFWTIFVEDVGIELELFEVLLCEDCVYLFWFWNYFECTFVFLTRFDYEGWESIVIVECEK